MDQATRERAEALLWRLRSGKRGVLGELVELYRDRLLWAVSTRLDPRLTGRISPEDILQEVFFDVSSRVDEYLSGPDVPFSAWLRFLAIQRLQAAARFHYTAEKRSVAREKRLQPDGDDSRWEARIGVPAAPRKSPSSAAAGVEAGQRLRTALAQMDPVDGEVLRLRHFEELSNHETAARLGISKEAASKRYARALKRLRAILAEAEEGTS